jgi:hypothetical protein
MTARIRLSSRVVFVLTLLLVIPAGARAETATPKVAVVAPLIRARFDDLGLGPHTVTVSRIIFTPDAGEESQSLAGPRLVVVESGALVFNASGNLKIIRAVAESAPGPTVTPTVVPTPTPVRSPTTDVVLGPGDAAPVPIWTMHSFRNEGTEPAVILDIRVTAGGAPSFPADLDVEPLTEETGLTNLPTGHAAIALGQGTIAPGGIVLAPPTGESELIAVAHGAGRVERAADGSFHNPGETSVDVYVVSIAPSGLAGPRQPVQPATGPGGAEIAFDRVVETHFGPKDQGYTLYEPAEPRPGTGMETMDPVPVILFLGGCCFGNGEQATGNRPSDVLAWLNHLTQRGAVVIYPNVLARQAQDDTVVAMRAAVLELENGNHVPVDWARFAVIGYSFGGWNAPIYAATSAAEGLPVPRAIFSTVAYDPGTPPDLSAIPASTYVIVLVDDDASGWSDHGARRIWAALTSVPANHREFVKVVSDLRGAQPLIANHQLPATGDYGTLNALDWYGTWKLGDALLSCTFAGQDCTYAFGNTSEERFMGYWSDGVPVAELEVVADPGPPDPATPTAQSSRRLTG